MHLQSCGGDNDIGIELYPFLRHNTMIGDSLNSIRHYIRLSALQRIEEIPIGADAQPLLPRPVARCEVGIQFHSFGDRFRGHAKKHAFRGVGEGAAEFEEEEGDDEEFPPHDFEGPFLGKPFARPVAYWVDGGLREDVARRTLEHCDSGSRGCDDRENCYGCCAGADYDHAFIGVVEVLGPELGVYDSAFEVLQAWDVRFQGVVVVVVAGAEDHEAGSVGCFLAFGVYDQSPQLIRG